MNEFANITDVQALKLFFYVESAILVIAFAIIGFFLRRHDNAGIAREVAVTTATENLTAAVNQLKLVFTSLQVQYEVRQPIVEAQIELFRQSFIIHDNTIRGIDNRLIQLETEHRLFLGGLSIVKNPKKNDLIN